MISQFISELTHPAVYLLEGWVSSHLNRTLLDNEEAAEDFRIKALYAAVRNGFLAAVEVLWMVGTEVNARDNEGVRVANTGSFEYTGKT